MHKCRCDLTNLQLLSYACVHLQVMQVYPTELAGRRQLHDYQLNAGKATMVSQGNVACQYETDISLLDVFDLPMSMSSNIVSAVSKLDD